MAKIHSKNMLVFLDDHELTSFVSSSTWTRTADTHDTTCYGQDAHTFSPGLTNGTFSMGGTYDSDQTDGPRAVIEPLIGAAAVELIRQPEGAVGSPEDVVQVLVTSYQESAPVADMIQWTADFQLSGDVSEAS